MKPEPYPAPSPDSRACFVLRPLVLLLATLTAILLPAALGPVAALGAPALGAQDRAGAFNLTSGILAGGRSVESPCSCRDLYISSGGVAVPRRLDKADRPSIRRAYGFVAVRMTRVAMSWAATPRVKDSVCQVAQRSTRTGNLILGDEDAAALDATEDVAADAGEEAGETDLNITAHGAERLAERGVSDADARDAYDNSLRTGPVKYDALGRPSQLLVGSHATIAVNPDTGQIITGWPTSSSLAARLGGEP